ncbi:S8 family serine peptidase [Streptomyces avermitilis]|uniref:S8 family serine peptidase n=1 Tax=Streptomyces avermitilis TaxID=33903 RepID=UPI00367D0AF1
MVIQKDVTDSTGREDEDVTNVLFQVRRDNQGAEQVEAYPLPDGAVLYDDDHGPKLVDEPEPQYNRDKVHPKLRQWLGSRSGDEREQLVVVLEDPVAMPRFPEPETYESRGSGTNRRLMGRAQELVRSIEQQRAPGYDQLETELAEYEANVIEQFWLINGGVVDMPLASVERLARREDVVSVEPRFSGEVPPQDEVDDGRTRVATDPYFNLGQTGGWIGLLDTGVRFSHTQFTNPSHIDFRRDCINGGTDCNTGTNLNPNDDCWNHGTSSAGIITANANQGNDFRGVTGITLDSFKVYATANPCGGLDQAAAVRGFQASVQALDRVIVAEMQGSGDHQSAIAQAADHAFDAGAVVIAANGNNGPNASTVNCPANARKAIGVGSFDVQTLQQPTSQSRGPTADGRTKPDVQAPTNTETASNTTDTATHVFTGTSGATPYASGAAALVRNWLRGGTGQIDPGQVYANLILAGQTPVFNNTTGAGPLRLPWAGLQTFGKVSVAHHATINIDFGSVSSTAQVIDAAIWWPESGAAHNDIDLSLVDPSGTVRASSTSIASVFERCRVTAPIAGGVWKVRIHGYNVPTSPQDVYVAVFTPPAP